MINASKLKGVKLKDEKYLLLGAGSAGIGLDAPADLRRHTISNLEPVRTAVRAHLVLLGEPYNLQGVANWQFEFARCP